MISPVVSHITCALDLQRRIAETRADAVARAVERRRRGTRLEEIPEASSGDPRHPGEDVWSALRF